MREQRAQGVAHFHGALEASVRVQLERLLDQRRDFKRNPGGVLLHRRRTVLTDGDDELAHALDVLVRRAASERFVEHDAERPEVGAVIDVLPSTCLLRRHVEGRAEQHPGVCQGAPVRQWRHTRLELGEAEVEELDDPRSAIHLLHEEIGGLDVAVHEAHGMNALQAGADLGRDSQGELRVQWAELRNPVVQVRAGQVLRDDVQRAGRWIRPRVQEPHDVP